MDLHTLFFFFSLSPPPLPFFFFSLSPFALSLSLSPFSPLRSSLPGVEINFIANVGLLTHPLGVHFYRATALLKKSQRVFRKRLGADTVCVSIEVDLAFRMPERETYGV